MEAVIDHTIERELTPPPPRRAALPLRVSGLLTVAVLLLLIFVAGSGRAIWEAVRLVWLNGAGHTATAYIDQIQTMPSPHQGEPLVQVAVHYRVDVPGRSGLLHRAAWVGLGSEAASSPLPGVRPRIQAAPPPAFQIGQPLPVRHAAWFGGVTSQLWLPDPRGRIGSLFLCGGLVLLVSLLLLRRLLRWAGNHLHLLRHGEATVGTITHTRTEAEDMLRYFVSYGYTPSGKEGREREEQVSADQWKQFSVGQPVTVLYDPDDPERAGLYTLIRG